jgi:hypothetical protein
VGVGTFAESKVVGGQDGAEGDIGMALVLGGCGPVSRRTALVPSVGIPPACRASGCRAALAGPRVSLSRGLSLAGVDRLTGLSDNLAHLPGRLAHLPDRLARLSDRLAGLPDCPPALLADVLDRPPGGPTDIPNRFPGTAPDPVHGPSRAATDVLDGATGAATDVLDGATCTATELTHCATRTTTDFADGVPRALAHLGDGTAGAATQIPDRATGPTTKVARGGPKAGCDLFQDLRIPVDGGQDSADDLGDPIEPDLQQRLRLDTRDLEVDAAKVHVRAHVEFEEVEHHGLQRHPGP